MNKKKVLITYFSVFPEKDKFTEKFAKMIAEITGGDLVEIECATQYPKLPEEYPLIEKMAHEELLANARPAIKNEIPVEDYDTIFVGYPIWWADLPMPVYTFFDEYDLSGKTIIPFSTHNGSRLSHTVQTIQDLEPGATVVTDALTVHESQVPDAKDDVDTWLTSLGFEIQ